MKNIICNKNVLDILRSLLNLLFKDIKFPPEFIKIFLVVFGDRKPHDADFHHLPQFHQVDIVLALMKNDAIYHGVDHDLIKAVAYKSSFCSAYFKDAVINKDLYRLSDRVSANSETLSQFQFGRDLIPGLELPGDDRLCNTVHNSLYD